MIKNILKITLRNLRRNKLFTFINIFGLSVGIAGFLLISSYVKYETEFDTFHDDADKIFRVVTNVSMRDGTKMNTCLTSPMLTQYLPEDFPQIESVTRFFPVGDTPVKYEDKIFYEQAFWFVDSTFFDVFDFKIILGDKDNLLKIPNSVIMCESVAKKYFGENNPIGKVVKVDGDKDFTVTGIVKNLPANSHFRFEVLAYYPTFRKFNMQNWGALSLYTYTKLINPEAAKEINTGFDQFVINRMGEQFKDLFDIQLEPMLSIHLYSEREHDLSIRTDSEQIYLLSIIALLIVLVACINFMNLSTARSSLRSLEIGVRKVLGANRKELIFQHLGESVFLTFFAVIFSFILYLLLLPELNELSGAEILLQPLTLIPTALLITLVVGLLAGSYPAIVLSGFKPVNMLKKSGSKNLSSNYIRKGLVLFQFSIAIGLLICTGIVYQQMEFVRNTNLGFEKDQVLFMPIRDDSVIDKIEVLKNAFHENSGVHDVSVASAVPGYTTHQLGYSRTDSSGQSYIFYTIFTDDNYVKTLGLKIIKGRSFSEDFSTDNGTGLIINESLAEKFSWKEPIGKELTWTADAAMNDTTRITGKIVGVVEDFYFQSMFNHIEPLVIRYDNRFRRLFALNINTSDVSKTINSLGKTWSEICSNVPFTSTFLNETYDNLYLSEERLGQLFFIFTLLAIVISCLGLFGLSSFIIERKIKEIGIRKVLGASVLSIVSGLSKEFSLWIILANVIAWPVAFYIMNNWLIRFEYKIEITLIPFILSALGAFIIAFTVIGFLSAKAAGINPVDSLRSE